MRIIIAAIVGGIIVFVWSAFVHIATPLGVMGLSRLPNETALMESFRSVGSSGMYFFPGMDMTKKPTHEEQKAWEGRIKAGPTGLLIITQGGERGTPQQLVMELVSDVIAALIAATLISLMVGAWIKRTFAVNELPLRRNSVTSAVTPGQFVSCDWSDAVAGAAAAGAGAAVDVLGML